MKNKKIEKIIIALTAAFVIMSVFLVFGGNVFGGSEDIRKTDSSVMPEATGTTNEIKKKTVVEQDFICTSDTISNLGVVFSRLAYIDGINLTIELLDGKEVLASKTINIGKIEDQHRTFIDPASKLSGMKNKKLTIRIYPSTEEDTGLVIMMEKNAKASFRFGSKTIKGTLCFSVNE